MNDKGNEGKLGQLQGYKKEESRMGRLKRCEELGVMSCEGNAK